MKLKDVLIKNFSDKESLTLKKLKSSRFVFVTTGLLFFCDYFLIANFPDNDFFIIFLPSLFLAFIFSLILLIYYAVKKKFLGKINGIFFFVFFIFLLIIGLLMSLPFLLDDKIIENIIIIIKNNL